MKQASRSIALIDRRNQTRSASNQHAAYGPLFRFLLLSLLLSIRQALGRIYIHISDLPR